MCGAEVSEWRALHMHVGEDMCARLAGTVHDRTVACMFALGLTSTIACRLLADEPVHCA